MQAKLFKNYQWIVHHPSLLGGQPLLRGLGFSVAQVLECFHRNVASGNRGRLPGFQLKHPEVLKFAAQQVQHVAA